MTRTAPLPGESLRIGRDLTNHVVFHNITVSRFHAKIVVRDGEFVLLDWDSANGTFLNGEKVSTASLKAGDVIGIGPCQVRWDGSRLQQMPDAEIAPPPPSDKRRSISQETALWAPVWREPDAHPAQRQLSSLSLAVFYRTIATMVIAGVPLARTIELTASQSEDEAMQRVGKSLRDSVLGGASVSEAMARCPQAFSALDVKLVRMGEVSGQLPLILQRLADYEEKRRALSMRINGALVYPLAVFGLSLGFMVILPPYLFGSLFRLIESLGVGLSPLTRAVLALDHAVGQPWLLPALVLGAALLARFLPAFWRRPAVQQWCAAFLLRFPLSSYLARSMATVRFARSFELLLSAALPIEHALAMSFDASANPVLQQRLMRSLQLLRDGQSVTQSLEAADFFPSAFLHMVRVGEESGRLPYVLSKILHLYEVEMEYAIDTLIAALEPMLLLIMGIVVGIFLVATLLPMVQIVSHL